MQARTLLFVMVLFSLVYIPINTYRIINIVDLANDTIKCFYQDIGVLQKFIVMIFMIL